MTRMSKHVETRHMTGTDEQARTRNTDRVSNRTHWLVVNVGREVVGCHCGFEAHPDDCGYGDSVVDHIYRVGLAEGAARSGIDSVC